MAIIHIGAIYEPPDDTSRLRHIHLQADQIKAIIPWRDVPHPLRELALDRARPHAGQPRTLFITTSGKYYPSARKIRAGDLRKVERAKKRVRSSAHRFRRPDHHLREAGFLPVAELAQATGYNADHLRLLAREGRCGAQKFRSKWYLHQQSLRVYMEKKPRRGKRGPH